MFNIGKSSGRPSYGVNHYNLDTPADLANLKVLCQMGSTAYIISTSEMYMLNSKREWVKQQTGTGQGGTSVTPTPDPEDYTVIYDGGDLDEQVILADNN